MAVKGAPKSKEDELASGLGSGLGLPSSGLGVEAGKSVGLRLAVGERVGLGVILWLNVSVFKA